jgi:hypothetical protein
VPSGVRAVVVVEREGGWRRMRTGCEDASALHTLRALAAAARAGRTCCRDCPRSPVSCETTPRPPPRGIPYERVRTQSAI